MSTKRRFASVLWILKDAHNLLIN